MSIPSISCLASGVVWQMHDAGVRPVMIRAWVSPFDARVSRRIGPRLFSPDGRDQSDYTYHVLMAPIASLFANEGDARDAFALRRVESGERVRQRHGKHWRDNALGIKAAIATAGAALLLFSVYL
jgi:hypothetical protein